MRRSLLLAAAAFCVAVPTLSAAQDGGHRGGGGGGHERGGEAAPAAAAQSIPAQAAPAAAPAARGYPQQRGNIRDRRQLFTGPNDPAATPQDRRELWGDRGGVQGRDRGAAQGGQRFTHDDRQGYQPGAGGQDFRRDRGDGGRDYRGGDNARQFRGDSGQRDFRGGEGQRFRGGFFSGERRAFNYNGRTFYRFRAEPYRWPNARYQNYRWSRGGRLPAYFLLPDYFISDYYALGLQPAPYGYQWVRVGYDVLLVDQYSGEIVDVVPGVFYW